MSRGRRSGLWLDINMGRTVWVEPPGTSDTYITVSVDAAPPTFHSSGLTRRRFIALDPGHRTLTIKHIWMPDYPENATLLGECSLTLEIVDTKRETRRCVGPRGRWRTITRRNPLTSLHPTAA